MTVHLTDTQYGHLMWAVRKIACGYLLPSTPYGGRSLHRYEMQGIARECCAEFGWSFASQDFPGEWAEPRLNRRAR